MISKRNCLKSIKSMFLKSNQSHEISRNNLKECNECLIKRENNDFKSKRKLDKNIKNSTLNLKKSEDLKLNDLIKSLTLLYLLNDRKIKMKLSVKDLREQIKLLQKNASSILMSLLFLILITLSKSIRRLKRFTIFCKCQNNRNDGS